MSDFPVKKINSPIMSDYRPAIDTACQRFKARMQERVKVLEKGFTDAPVYQYPQVLFKNNERTLPIYKVNAQGYIYVHLISMQDTYNGVAIYLASSASNMTTKRLLYQTSVGGSGISDTMFMIPTGASTYLLLKPLFDNDSNPPLIASAEYWFLPTVEAYSYNIADNNYVTKVGEIARTSVSESSGYVSDLSTVSDIFTGDWKDNYPDSSVIFGQRFAALSRMTFTNDSFKSDLKASRQSWLSTCANGEIGPSPAIYPNEM